MRPVTVTTGRHPYQSATAAGITAAGTAMAVTGLLPASIAALPTPLVVAWQVILTTGGAIALLGAYWPGELDTALTVEAGAHVMIASALTLYVVATAVAAPARASSVALAAALAVAAWWRAGQIVRQLTRATRAARAGHTTDITVLSDQQDSS